MKIDLLKYSMQLAMLKQLFSNSLITEREYTLMKQQLMDDYEVSSNLTSVA